MSMLVHHFVMHQLGLNNEEKLVLSPRPNCLVPSPALDGFCHQLNHAFNSKPSKGIGCFSDDNKQFQERLHTITSSLPTVSGEQEFHSFSVEAGSLLLDALINTNTVETGFLIFAQFEYLATQYLMIGLLNTKEHVEVTQSLELTSKEHLDLARMQLAVKIDLTQYTVQPEQARYISFIKGRMGRKVSDFFMHFIGCEEQVDVKQQNRLLVSSVDQYLAQEGLEAEEKNQHREQVKAYVKAKHREGDDISIKEIATHLPTNLAEQRDFSRFVMESETPMEPSFAPDPAAVRQLAKFSGQGGGVSLAFERKLLGERIYYEPQTDTLTIKGIPPNLKDQLIRATQSQESE